MGDDERPPMNERNAANRARFERLPAAGSPAYWAALEDTAEATRLELEILAMCARERRAAGKGNDFERTLGMLWDRVQGKVREQIERSVPSGARDRTRVIEDIMQECVTSLWLELSAEGPTFLTLGFWHKMRFMVANTSTQRLIAEGIRTRVGVQQSERVPQSKMDSFEQPVGPNGDYTLGDSIVDPQAQEQFAQAERVSDLVKLLEGLTAEQRLLIQNEWTGELTQKQMGALLGGITDRAVRMRLTALQAMLRARRNASDTPSHPPQAPGKGDGSAGGEEGQS